MKKYLISFLVVCFVAGNVIADDIAYYNQFLYKMENTSDDPDFPSYQYRYLMSDSQLRFPIPNSENKLMLWVSVYLLDGNKYRMVYKEHILYPAGHFFPNGCVVKEGNWSVIGEELFLDDIMIGSKHMMHDRHAVKYNFKQTLISDAVLSAEVPFSYGVSNVGLDQAKCFPFE